MSIDHNPHYGISHFFLKCIFCNKKHTSELDNEFIIKPISNFSSLVACKSCLERNVNMKRFK